MTDQRQEINVFSNRTIVLISGATAGAADDVYVRARKIAARLPVNVTVDARQSSSVWKVTVTGARRDVAVFQTYWKD